MHLCDAAALNAYVLFNGGMTRRSFIVELADQLMQGQKERKADSKHWVNEGFRQIDELYKGLRKKATGHAETAPFHHCYICKKTGRGKNIWSCSKCEKQVCGDHATELVLCALCNGSPPALSSKTKPETTTMRTRQTPISQSGSSCYKCTKVVHFRCSICNSLACKDHRSKLNPSHCGDCEKNLPRPPKPKNRQAIIDWYKKVELPNGTGLDPKTGQPASWFHGIISRIGAEQLLANQPTGAFLVRVSERIWGYTVSYVVGDGTTKHFLVEKILGGYQFLGTNQLVHSSLYELVYYHQAAPITAKGKEILGKVVGQTSRQAPDYSDLIDNNS
uniref:SH2 domain-containing protein n=1 Tax=Ditylenchus dipsaci TaxID=166011 RepID=A0A915EB81_9BILA